MTGTPDASNTLQTRLTKRSRGEGQIPSPCERLCFVIAIRIGHVNRLTQASVPVSVGHDQLDAEVVMDELSPITFMPDELDQREQLHLIPLEFCCEPFGVE